VNGRTGTIDSRAGRSFAALRMTCLVALSMGCDPDTLQERGRHA
jgi:hypothetical protein